MLSRKNLSQALVRYFSQGTEYNLNHSSQLRVVSTNQWPIPYYQRANFYPATYYPENDYNVSLVPYFREKPGADLVFITQQILDRSIKGREALKYMHNSGHSGSLSTEITSPVKPAEAYTEDLLSHIDYTIKENARILKKHKISDVFS